MTVSVVIPCYNVRKYITECLSSVYKQNYDNLQVICVDNASEDGTYNTLLELQEKKYPNLVVEQEQQEGAPCARNKGLEQAEGEWVQFLDADDLLLPQKISHQIEEVAEYSRVPFVAGSYYKQDLDGTRTEVQPLEDVWKGLFTTRLGNTCANLFRTRRVREVGGWDTDLESSQEYDLMFRLLQEERNLLLDRQPHTIIRERATGQISNRDGAKRWARYVQLRVKIMEYLRQNESQIWQDDKEFFRQKLFESIRSLARYDLATAKEYLREYIPEDFVPNITQANSWRYMAMYRILGFEKTEKLKTLIV